MQQRVFDVLFERPNTDVSIHTLYCAAYVRGLNPKPLPKSTREAQQKLGPVIARINSKLRNARIEPGRIKQTYRINTKLKD